MVFADCTDGGSGTEYVVRSKVVALSADLVIQE